MVCHCDEVPERRLEAGPTRGAWAKLGRAAGPVPIGVRRAGIPEGGRSSPAFGGGVDRLPRGRLERVAHAFRAGDGGLVPRTGTRPSTSCS